MILLVSVFAFCVLPALIIALAMFAGEVKDCDWVQVYLKRR